MVYLNETERQKRLNTPKATFFYFNYVITFIPQNQSHVVILKFNALRRTASFPQFAAGVEA